MVGRPRQRLFRSSTRRLPNLDVAFRGGAPVRVPLGMLLFVTALLLVAALPDALPSALAWSLGPPDRHTYADSSPREECCCDCHEFERNTGVGSVRIKDVPAIYLPGQQYRIRVVAEMPGQSLWGFELSVRDRDHRQAGLLETTGNDTVIAVTNDIQWAKHAPGGKEADSFAVWFLAWKAPKAGTGVVTFFVAANAGDGDGTADGDYVYTSDVSSDEVADTTPFIIGAVIAAVLLPLTLLYRRRLAKRRSADRDTATGTEKRKKGKKGQKGRKKGGRRRTGRRELGKIAKARRGRRS